MGEYLRDEVRVHFIIFRASFQGAHADKTTPLGYAVLMQCSGITGTPLNMQKRNFTKMKQIQELVIGLPV